MFAFLLPRTPILPGQILFFCQFQIIPTQTGGIRGWTDPLVSMVKSKLSRYNFAHMATLSAILFQFHLTLKMLHDHAFAFCVYVMSHDLSILALNVI